MSAASVFTRLCNQPLKTRITQGLNEVKVLLAGPHIGVSHLVEFPKCGGTWIKNMVQHVVGGESHYSDRLVRRNSVVHLHRLYSARYCRPIVLFRDPRDVYVSYYFYERALQAKGAELGVNRYLRFSDDRDRAAEFFDYLRVKLEERTDPYFTYREFADAWLGRDGVCYTSYERFKEDAHDELARVIRFLGQTPDAARIDAAVDYFSFENVTRRKTGSVRKPGQEDAGHFQRKGVVGDWRNHFNEASLQYFDRHMGDVLARLGYASSDEGVLERGHG